MPGDLVPVGNAAAKGGEQAQLTIKPVSGPARTFVFPFNPYQLRLRKSARWRNHISPEATGAGATEWAGTSPRSLELAVVLDRSEVDQGDVLPLAKELLACCEPPAGAHGATAAPKVRFSWGTAIELDAVMTDVAVTFTEFWPDGTPFRAEAVLELREVTTAAGPQNPTSGGPAGRRAHVVVAGDTLASVAYREYGDPTRWRELAEHNGIDDPFRLRVGTVLSVPVAGDRTLSVGAGRGS